MSEKNKTLQEVIVPYNTNFSINDLFSNKLDLIKFIRKGIPYSFFEKISQFTNFNEQEWASILNISTKSLHRYKQAEKSFKSIHSEKILEMIEITKIGLDVFEDNEKFNLWLDTPNFSLGNYKPKDLIKDSYGKELVITELNQIKYGLFA